MATLTDEERAMLSGAQGPGTQKAMEIIYALAEVYEASTLVPVTSAQVAGVSYKNLGEAGLEFLQDWAAMGARVRVPAFMNPAGMDLERWQEMGVSPQFAAQQTRVVEALESIGVARTCTCTPYLVGHSPRLGDHLAWSESSAVSYANSVLGAHSNREGGPSALAAAITGRTAAYGLHLARSRRPTHRVQVSCPVLSEADYGALGYLVGRQVADGVPLFRFERGALQSAPRQEDLMALGAAMGASGAVALYHVEGVTPEACVAPGEGLLPPGVGSEALISVNSLAEGYAALDSPLDHIDFVSIGCPHATPDDLERIADALDGKRVRAILWVTTSRAVRQWGESRRVVGRIEAAGGKVYADTCLVVAPVEEMGFGTMATNSAKAAFYGPSHSGLRRRFGTLEQCLAAAVTGRWEPVGQKAQR